MEYKKAGHYAEITLDEEHAHVSLIDFLGYFYLSKKNIHKLRMSHDVYINDKNIKQNFKIVLQPNDKIKLPLFIDEAIDFIPQTIPLNIIYEDDFSLVINKQKEIEIHPENKTGLNTLVNGVAHYYKQTKQNHRIRYIHRLDRDTTGIIVFAKNYFIHNIYDFLLTEKKIKRYYLALTTGNFPQEKGYIDKKIGRDRHNRKKYLISKTGLIAKTFYKVIKHYPDYTLVELELFTGRTHQIRVHLNSLGCPILGDNLYGNSSPLINRQALHAYKIELIHPFTLKPFTITAKPPNDFEKLL